MAMTMTQKILAAHAGLESVKAGQLIEANLDLVLGNDITSPVAVKEFEKFGVKDVFDKEKIAIVPDHFTPNKDIKAAEQCKFIREFSREKEIVNLMMNPDYEFECNISEEMFSEGVILPGAAYIWFEDIGVEFEFCIENGENYSAIYRMDMNKAGDDFETDHDEFYHYEIDPTDPEWKANLEIEMCRVLILLHDLK